MGFAIPYAKWTELFAIGVTTCKDNNILHKF
jgi:hypothetical protein